MLGEPLIELGAALRRANMREIALAPSARKLLTAMPEVTMVACHGKPSRKSASETGLFTMANIPFSVARSSPHRSAVMMPTPVWRLSHSWSVGHSTRKSLSASGPDSKHLVRQVAAHAKVLCKLAACAAKRTSGNRSRSQSSTLSRSSSSSQRSSSMDVGIGGALSGSQGSDSNFNHVLREDSLAGMPCLRRAQGAGAEAMDGQGLGAILRFMPSFVRGKHDTEEGLQSLEEHRAVTVLFVIANVEVSWPLRSRGCDLASLFAAATLYTCCFGLRRADNINTPPSLNTIQYQAFRRFLPSCGATPGRTLKLVIFSGRAWIALGSFEQSFDRWLGGNHFCCYRTVPFRAMLFT